MARQFNATLTLGALRKRLEPAPTPEPGKKRLMKGAPPVRVLPVATEADSRLISDWLTQLHKLKGVPFNYLVPDIAMLPAESLRFFQVDKAWIDALLDGAFSLGAAGVAPAATQQARQAFSNDAQRRQRLSGFLLRSTLIDNWPGLEVEGFDSQEGPEALRIVRMERVAPGVLLCIFAGVVTQVCFATPGESAHLGVSEIDNDSVRQRLRALKDQAIGTFTSHSAEVAFRHGGRRVIPLAALAANMAQVCGTPLTSASFALQMLGSVDRVIFQWVTHE